MGSDGNGIRSEKERDPLGLDRARPENEVGPMDGSADGAAGHPGLMDSDDHHDDGPHERWPSIRMSTGSNAGAAAPPPPMNPDTSRFAGGTPSDSDASLHLSL